MWGISQVLILMLALVLANAVFAAAEISVISVRRSRIKHLLEGGDRRAKAVDLLHGNVERFLATVQIGINVVGAFGAAIGGAALSSPLADVLRQVPLPLVQSAADQLALALVVAGFSFFSILIGELVPKSLGLRYAEPLALRFARPLIAMGVVARPVVWLLTSAANVLLKPFHDKTSFVETRLSAEEIKLLVGEAAEAGSIEKRGAEIIERAVDFGELTVAEVLVPRRQVVAIDLTASADEVRRVILEQGHSRMPVIDGHLDKVVGYVTAKDVLTFAGGAHQVVLKEILRPAYFVPETMRALDLLRALQKRHEHLAIAVDEYGGTSGLVTTEDLVEEIVGDLFAEDATAPELIHQDPDGTAQVQASLPVREFNRAFDSDLPEHEAYDTLAGMLTHLAGTIPVVGQSFTVQGFEFAITERSDRRVKQVRVRQLPKPPEAP